MFGSPLKWVLVLAPLGLVFFMSFRIQNLQAATARLLFFLYAGLLGLSLATVFMVYTRVRARESAPAVGRMLPIGARG